MRRIEVVFKVDSKLKVGQKTHIIFGNVRLLNAMRLRYRYGLQEMSFIAHI